MRIAGALPIPQPNDVSTGNHCIHGQTAEHCQQYGGLLTEEYYRCNANISGEDLQRPIQKIGKGAPGMEGHQSSQDHARLLEIDEAILAAVQAIAEQSVLQYLVG